VPGRSGPSQRKYQVRNWMAWSRRTSALCGNRNVSKRSATPPAASSDGRIRFSPLRAVCGGRVERARWSRLGGAGKRSRRHFASASTEAGLPGGRWTAMARNAIAEKAAGETLSAMQGSQDFQCATSRNTASPPAPVQGTHRMPKLLSSNASRPRAKRQSESGMTGQSLD
jgi:hypothetical protein